MTSKPGKPCRWKKTKPERTPGGARVSVSTRPRRRRYSPHGAANGLHSLARRQYGGIQHQGRALPDLIFPFPYRPPVGEKQTGNFAQPRFHPCLMRPRIRADKFHFQQLRARFKRYVPPGIASQGKRVDAIRQYGKAQPQIIQRQGIAHIIARWPQAIPVNNAGADQSLLQ